MLNTANTQNNFNLSFKGSMLECRQIFKPSQQRKLVRNAVNAFLKSAPPPPEPEYVKLPKFLNWIINKIFKSINKKNIKADLRKVQGEFFQVVDKKRKVIGGFIGTIEDNNHYHIETIYVSPKIQKTHKAAYALKSIMKKIKSRAVVNQCETISLEVDLRRYELQDAYRSVGFKSAKDPYDKDNQSYMSVLTSKFGELVKHKKINKH